MATFKVKSGCDHNLWVWARRTKGFVKGRGGKGAQWPSRVDRLLLRHTKPFVAPTPPLNSFRKTGPSGDQGANENLLGMAR